MSALIKYTPPASAPKTKRPRSAYLATKTTTILILAVTIVLFLFSKISLPSFNPFSQNAPQNIDRDLYPDLPFPENEPAVNISDNLDLDLDLEPHGSDCPYSTQKPYYGRREKNNRNSSSAVSSGEFWISDLGPIEQVHIKLNSSME